MSGFRNINYSFKEDLLGLFLFYGYSYSAEKCFRLASGKMSNYYIDCKAVLSRPHAKVAVGNVIYNCIKDLSISAIGGLTHGADPIAEATSIIAYQKGKIVQTFLVRKEPKDHGLKKWIEGFCVKGERVVIVDDVMTTGGSTMDAIEKVREAGMFIEKVIVLVDRLEGGRERIKKTDCKYEAIFPIDDLRNGTTARSNRRSPCRIKRDEDENIF
jgi:orotate phosphoribosyltransferase